MGRELGKALAKYGTAGMKKAVAKSNPGTFDIRGQAIRAYAKNLADERVNHLVAPPFKLGPKEASLELPHDKGVRAEYLNDLVTKVHTKAEVRTVISYIKSAAASNLGPDERAHLLMKCLDKLKYIDVIGQFLG